MDMMFTTINSIHFVLACRHLIFCTVNTCQALNLLLSHGPSLLFIPGRMFAFSNVMSRPKLLAVEWSNSKTLCKYVHMVHPKHKEGWDMQAFHSTYVKSHTLDARQLLCWFHSSVDMDCLLTTVSLCLDIVYISWLLGQFVVRSKLFHDLWHFWTVKCAHQISVAYWTDFGRMVRFWKRWSSPGPV